MKAAVYWNLHKDIFSIQSREASGYGKVVAHTDSVVVAQPRFVVRQAGREKVLRDKSKNVHAFVVGKIEYDMFFSLGKGRLITYNPYKYKSFVFADTKEPITKGVLVQLRTHENKPVMELYQ
jgi:hypothetical protein